jgi:hypothetical protein
MRPELIALTVNALTLAWYIYQRAEPGKILYWTGAVILTIGLLKMKG